MFERERDKDACKGKHEKKWETLFMRLRETVHAQGQDWEIGYMCVRGTDWDNRRTDRMKGLNGLHAKKLIT